MPKTKNLSPFKKFLGSHLFSVLLIFLAAGSVYIYDRTIWIAYAQTNNNSTSAVLTCKNNTNGNLRVVDSVDKCKSGEQSLALQGAISNLLSDVEVVWHQPPGDRNTNYDAGIDVACPDGKIAIGGGNTEVVRQNAPKDESITGNSGRTSEPVENWSIAPWRYEQAPIVYAICAKVNK